MRRKQIVDTLLEMVGRLDSADMGIKKVTTVGEVSKRKRKAIAAAMPTEREFEAIRFAMQNALLVAAYLLDVERPDDDPVRLLDATVGVTLSDLYEKRLEDAGFADVAGSFEAVNVDE